MASIATAATVTELNALSDAAHRLVVALREVKAGIGNGAVPGRLTAVEVDALITALSTAITNATT